MNSPLWLRLGKPLGYVFLVTLLFSCQKEEALNTDSEKIQWMRVLEDTLSYSSDNEIDQGKNGKVITDPDDNIYTYYYSKDREQTVVSKYDAEGTPVWKKTFDQCKPLDMVRLNNGSLIIAASLKANYPNYLTLYSINTDGSIESRNDTIKDFFWSCAEVYCASIYPMPDNSFIVSGVWNSFISGSNASGVDTKVFMIKHSQLQVKDWGQYFGFCFTCPYEVVKYGFPLGTSAMISTSSGQYVFQFAYDNNSMGDGSGHNILTGILNADGSADTSFIYDTGIYNRYGNGFIQDYYGDFISYYSSPRQGGNFSQAVPAGFLRLGQDAQIKDTIPVSIPSDYRIISCTKGSAGYMLTAYKSGVASGSNDYSAEHTLFVTGGTDWRSTGKFYFQQFYSDFFFSNAPTSEGGYISMGRIQSFNGPTNKLVLVKWKK